MPLASECWGRRRMLVWSLRNVLGAFPGERRPAMGSRCGPPASRHSWGSGYRSDQLWIDCFGQFCLRGSASWSGDSVCRRCGRTDHWGRPGSAIGGAASGGGCAVHARPLHPTAHPSVGSCPKGAWRPGTEHVGRIPARPIWGQSVDVCCLRCAGGNPCCSAKEH